MTQIELQEPGMPANHNELGMKIPTHGAFSSWSQEKESLIAFFFSFSLS